MHRGGEYRACILVVSASLLFKTSRVTVTETLLMLSSYHLVRGRFHVSGHFLHRFV